MNSCGDSVKAIVFMEGKKIEEQEREIILELKESNIKSFILKIIKTILITGYRLDLG